ncbi:MAG: TonB-dependent receptor [Saprospiraceae bacterium]
MQRILLLILFVSFCGMLQAQNTIGGKILSGKEPLIGANVEIKGSSEGAVSDENGSFSIETSQSFPMTIVVTYLGFSPKEVLLNAASSNINVNLEEENITLTDVVIKGQRVSDKQKAAPLSVESVDLLAIKETPSISFYNGLGNLKGVDLTTASLGFTIINMRGFNSTSPVRSLQLIDGVDNQAPGLNFSLGNFLGVSELDILRADLIAGASSAYYGPNAFNGVVSMETRNPFFHKGLSASIKVGERQLFEGAIKWADAFKNKNGQEFVAYKLNFFHLRANDWEATNYDAVYQSPLPQSNPGGYDAVNIYGDEYNASYKIESRLSYKGLESWSRRGYRESDLVDYKTRNTKANAALYFRTKPSLEEASPEFIINSSFGAGTTVYQGDNRFSLKNILFFQNRLEYRKRDKFFIRAYATHEDAGDSYDPYFTALQLQAHAKSGPDWYNDFISYWQGPNTVEIVESGYPTPERLDSILLGGQWIYKIGIPDAKYNAWKDANKENLENWYEKAKIYADTFPNPLDNSVAFYEPGTDRFQDLFNKITSTKSNKRDTSGGTQFFDKSALYHIQGEYKFTPSWGLITTGANARLYVPNSEGTIFYDTTEQIRNFEAGIYGGIEKKFWQDKMTASVTLRLDKNQNFDLLASPAASLVYSPKANNFLRFSFSSAIRNPTLTDQYLNLNVGPAILAGNLNGVDSLITVESFKEYLDSFNSAKLQYFNIGGVVPEKVKTFEIGYRTTLWNNLYMDAGYYFSVYNDFLGYNIGIKSTFDGLTGLPEKTQVYRYSANSRNQVTTQGFNIGLNYYFAQYFMIGGNYSWNVLNKKFEDDPIIPAFNTPKHKYNLSLSGRDMDIKLGTARIQHIGFNINYKWVDGFLFEGSPQFTGFIPTYALVDAQISYGIPRLNLTLKVGASNLLNNQVFQTYGGPKIGRMGYVSLTFEAKKK